MERGFVMMKSNEALKAMIDGEKVTHCTYNKGSYYYWNRDESEFWFYSAFSGLRSKATVALNYKDRYEIYKEPKKKEKYWLWLNPVNGYVTSKVFNEQGFSVEGDDKVATFTVKLAWSEVSL
jgi:hypothetical protein